VFSSLLDPFRKSASGKYKMVLFNFMRISGANFFWTCAALALVAILVPVVSAGPLSAGQQQRKTVWDGAYTAEQAARGRQAYLKECGSCHSENLQGGDEAPGLVGSAFLAQWVDLSAGDLFERTRISMPQDRPSQLSRATYADVLAHIFKVNGFPEGSTELPTETVALKAIMIVTKPEK